MKALHMISFTLLVIGGLNWGIWGVTSMQTNVLHNILGSWGPVEMIIYVLVGLAAIYEALTHKSNCKYCGSKDGAMMNKPAM